MAYLTLYFVVTVITISSAANLRGPKVWWAKPVAEDFYTAGRPSVRQLKYIAEAGFKSVMSFMNFTRPIPELDIPTTTEEEQIVKGLGLKFGVVLPPGMDILDKMVFEHFARVYEKMEKPIFYHCAISYSATYSSLGYFANRTKHDPNFMPRVTLEDIYTIGARRGYDWHKDLGSGRPTVAEVLHSFLGDPNFEVPTPDISLPDFMFDYWWPLPVHGRYYAMGQLQRDQLGLIKKAGFTTIVNLRAGVGKVPREEVTLLNVYDDTGPDRQNVSRLMDNRIDPSKPNSYISATSTYNFDVRNPLEFGDAIGYNSIEERAAVEAAGLKLYHVAIGDGENMTAADWRQFYGELRKITRDGNVLIHSRTGWKAVAVGLLLAGKEYCLGSNWAKKQAEGIGYAFGKQGGDPAVNKLFEEELGPFNSIRGPKVWWAKPVAEDFYIGGRPSRRHLKYIAEAGFRSVISFMNFTNPDLELDIPTTTEEEQIVKGLGLKFGVVMPPGMDDRDLKLYEQFGKVYEQMEKPIFYHCMIGYSAAYSSLGYFANRTKHDPNFMPRITLEDIYTIGARRGYDWAKDFKDGRPTIAEVLHSFLGAPTFDVPKLATSLPDFMFDYWWPLPVHGRYYAMGQFQLDQLEQIKKAGFDTVINLRGGVSLEPRNEVTLLNVKDDTGPDRQNVSNLKIYRIDASKPNFYISAMSMYNFDTRNPLEFGDAVGYNETKEREAVRGMGLRYHHVPLGEDCNLEEMTVEDWRGYSLALREVTRTGNILIHSRTGNKAVVVALLLAGKANLLDANWAKQQADGIGYPFKKPYGDPAVNHILEKELGPFMDMRGPKTWWAKPVAEGFYIAGRPSRRHLKYLAETGFKSVMSIMDFQKPIPELDIPTTTEEERIVAELGMKFGTVMTPGMSTRDLELYERFGEVYEQMEKPIFYHCAQGFAAMYSSFGYFANRTMYDPDFRPHITLEDIYEMGAKRGYYWGHDFGDGRKTVAEVLHSFLGEPTFDVPKPSISLPDFMFVYWWPLAVYGRYYAMGQIQSDQLGMMEKAGFTTIINLRRGVSHRPREEVTLLNVKDNTGYNRQYIRWLMYNRINASRPNSYISPTSMYNFELRNPLEFGDQFGHNADLERIAVRAANMTYHHIPLGYGESMSTHDWTLARQLLMDATKTGNIIIHSRTGWKAVAVALLLAGKEHGLDSNWAMEQAAGIAYAFKKPQSDPVLNAILKRELGP